MSRPRPEPGRWWQAALAALLLLLPGPAPAQDEDTSRPPYVVDAWRYGVAQDAGSLRYCIDTRDPEWPIARDIAQAAAAALLLRPAEALIDDDGAVTDGWTQLYTHLLADCDLYFGFKLIPSGYPAWLALSRPYYSASYVLAVTDPGWTALADIPPDRPIGAAIGTSADLTFIKYLETLPPARRWPRYPMSDTEATVQALVEGRVAAALVWGPALWALQQQRPELQGLRLISPAPLATTSLGVGAALLARQTFLRTSFDQAIAQLAADGTLARIIAAHHFIGEVTP